MPAKTYVNPENLKQALEETLQPIEAEISNKSLVGHYLGYGLFEPDDQTFVEQKAIKMSKKAGTIDIDENGIISLLPNKVYSLSGKIVSGKNCAYSVWDVTHNKEIASAFDYMSNQAVGCTFNSIIETGKDVLQIKIVPNKGLEYKKIQEYSKVTIQEIQRQVIVDPAEEAKKVPLDYAKFGLLRDTSVAENTLNSQIVLDRKEAGNLNINANNNIVLNANKLYKVILTAGAVSGSASLGLKNVTENIVYNDRCLIGHTTYKDSNAVVYFIQTTQKTEIQLINCTRLAGVLDSRGVGLSIEEIAHPYYFNYYKDSIGTEVIFEGDANKAGEYGLLNSINKYKWLDVECSLSENTDMGVHIDRQTIRVYVDSMQKVKSEYAYVVSVAGETRRILFSFKNDNTLVIDSISIQEKSLTARVERIIGVGFIYDNPYKDLISVGGDTNTFTGMTDAEIQTLDNKLVVQ